MEDPCRVSKIKKIRCIRSRAGGHWVIVKVLTDQPGLWGIGSANDYHHSSAVVTAMEEVVAPRLIGRDAADIEDIWQSTFTSAYWRNSSILNVLLGGIDMALWDIKGKEAGMPVYQLLGGRCRTAVPCYAHASGNDFESLADDIQRYLEEGYPVVRCQLGGYGGGGFIESERAARPKNAWPASHVFDDEAVPGNHPEDVRTPPGEARVRSQTDSRRTRAPQAAECGGAVEAAGTLSSVLSSRTCCPRSRSPGSG